MAADQRAELLTLVRSVRHRLERAARAGQRAVPSGSVGSLPGAAVHALDAEEEASPITIRRSLDQIRAELGDCRRCPLAAGRASIVFGSGAIDASLMFVGEGPGEQEDRTGEPFVGKAGGLLTNMIRAMGWGRDQVYIANVVKCRPPGNRAPEPNEVATCSPFLAAQIDAIAPRMIVALGRPAANALLGNQAPISALRGTFHRYKGIAVMPTFHPAYLLRSPEKKREAWQDLQAVMAELGRLGIAPPETPPQSPVGLPAESKA